MKYKLLNHPCETSIFIIDFSDFEGKSPGVFVDQVLSFLIDKIPDLNKFEPSGNKSILFLDLDCCSASFSNQYVLGKEDGDCVDSIKEKEISRDMFEIYEDLLKIPEEEGILDSLFGKEDCKKFVLLRFMLYSVSEYYDKNVFLKRNNIKEEKKEKGILYSNYSYLHKKPQMIGHGLIGYYVPLGKRGGPKYNMGVLSKRYDLVSYLKYKEPEVKLDLMKLFYFIISKVFGILLWVLSCFFCIFCLSKVLGYIVLFI